MKKYLIVLAAALVALAGCKNEKKPGSEYTSIKFKEATVSLAVGETKKLNVLYEPTTLTPPTCEWSSSNEAVATVDNGTITAVAGGDANITAKVGDLTAVCAVHVASVYDLIEWEGLSWWTAADKTPLTNDTVEVTISYGGGTLVHCVPCKVYCRVWGQGLYYDDNTGLVAGDGIDAFNEGMGLLITDAIAGQPAGTYILGSDYIEFVDPAKFNWNDTTFLFCCPAGKITGTAEQHYSYLTGASETAATVGAELYWYNADEKDVEDGLLGFFEPGLWIGSEEGMEYIDGAVNWFTFASDETPSYYGLLLALNDSAQWDFAEPKAWAPQMKSTYQIDNRKEEEETARQYHLIPANREMPAPVKSADLNNPKVFIKK